MGTAAVTEVLTPDFFSLPQKRRGMAVILMDLDGKVAMVRKPVIHIVGAGSEPGFDYQFPQDYYDDGNGELQGQAARRVMVRRFSLTDELIELRDVSKVPTLSPLPEKHALEKGAQSLLHDWALMCLRPGVSPLAAVSDIPTGLVVWVNWWRSWELCNAARRLTYRTACLEFDAYLPPPSTD